MATTHVFLEGLVLSCFVGVPKEERLQRQPIHIEINCDLGTALIKKDNILETLNYANIHQEVLRMANTTSFVLLETLVAAIAMVCFQDEHVVKTTVSARKLNKLPQCGAVGVTRTFQRSEVTQ